MILTSLDITKIMRIVIIFHTATIISQHHRGRGATGSRGSIDPPLFQVQGPPMVLDPALLSGSVAIITDHTAQTDVQNVKFAEIILVALCNVLK